MTRRSPEGARAWEMAAELDAARARVAALEAENERLREALQVSVNNTARARRELGEERSRDARKD